MRVLFADIGYAVGCVLEAMILVPILVCAGVLIGFVVLAHTGWEKVRAVNE